VHRYLRRRERERRTQSLREREVLFKVKGAYRLCGGVKATERGIRASVPDAQRLLATQTNRQRVLVRGLKVNLY
jgi:hypothetical protein